MYNIEKMDKKMKKKVLIIISTAFLLAICSEASSKVEMITNKTSLVNINKIESKITIKECKKHLGLENYNFINKIYSDENVALSKCKEELKK